ncbi:MAG: DUF5103 domain-containing protein [Melioribacteraceae bacterium]|nr:DUF5103 domain-containing protein [Melioribacteraceae bacterium]
MAIRLILFLVLSNALFAQALVIKSLRAIKFGDDTSPPVITVGEKLKIEFDVKADIVPDLIILFRFCDRNWVPEENIFLVNNGYNTEYNLWFDRLPPVVEGADYRYEGVFPNNNVKFPYSGKWRYYITDIQDTSNVFASGKFYYIDPKMRIDVSLKRVRLEGRTVDPSILGQVFDITTRFTLPDSLEEFRLGSVEIIENHKFGYPVIIEKDFTGTDKYYEWIGNNYRYTVKNVSPGNEYRQTDLRDRNKYRGPSTFARFEGVDVSRLYSPGGNDFNGGFKLTNPQDEYADYMDVTFELRVPEKISGDVFLVGGFSNWEVYPGNKMLLADETLYYTVVELKRGIYDYQYVTGIESDGRVENINWNILEGNDWNTENNYYIFVFYNTAEKGGYDEIIGFKKIMSEQK